jgi:hypothetical protein
MADVFTPELTFGQWQAGIETPTAPGAPYRTIQQNNFTPASLFAGGAQGFWLDPYDLSMMFQSGTRAAPGTPVSADGQPVGLWLDKSGKQNDFQQATAGSRPIFHTSSGLSWVEFDGVDDSMASPTGDLSGSPKLAIMSAHLLSNTIAALISNQALVGGTAGAFGCLYQAAVGVNSPANATLGDGVVITSLYETTVTAPPRTVIQTWQLDFSGALNTDEIKIRRNGVDQTMSVNAAGPCSTVNFASSQLNLGQTGGGLFLQGKVYGLVGLGAGATAAQIADTEAYLAAKSGVTLG